MSAAAKLQLSSDLYQTAQKAVDYALKALNAADPLVPFAITWRDEETTVERYMHGAYEDSIEMAMRAVSDTDEGVSAYPQAVTGQMLLNFARGGAAVNVLARRAGARLLLADLGQQPYLQALQAADAEQAERLMRREGIRWINSTARSIEGIATNILRELRIERPMY